jgi:hypothetical protein
MLAIVAIGCVVTIAFAERIGVNLGLGWDGRAYAHWAQDLAGIVSRRELDGFQAQRVLPSAIVHYVLRAVGASASPGNVIFGFQVLDALSLLAAAACLCRIATILGWSRNAAWAAFASMFGGFAITRHALYVPVLTDPMAFALGALSVLGYIERRSWLVVASALAAVFVWPASLTVNALALVFPRAEAKGSPQPAAWIEPIRRKHVAALAATLASAAMSTWFVQVLLGYHDVDGMEGILARGHRSLWLATIFVTVAITATAGWFLGAAWTGRALASYVRTLRARSVVLAIVALAGLLAIRGMWVAHASTARGFSIEALEYYYVGNALRAPLWSLVHHAVYFGPFVLLVIQRWRAIADQAARWGLAPSTIWAIVLFVGVTPETRHLIAFLPWMVVFAIDATRDAWNRLSLAVYIVLVVIWSKVWFVIGYEAHHDSFRFPDQRYMMNLGPWSTDGPALVHGTAAVLSAALLWLALRQGREARSPGEQAEPSAHANGFHG